MSKDYECLTEMSEAALLLGKGGHVTVFPQLQEKVFLNLPSDVRTFLQQFSIKPTTTINPKTKPSIAFICGTFDSNSL
ncbi:MAG TPA: hypothetical protein VE944_08545 [Nostoc sp.]|uniref:hypothetical protein n=1 Tax=Nostoc sp. TaxID=1180 RepID=UPI002D4D7855|nr:hypothetical protein [Nostoc sp.]HYX14404.1 hypothetical protein [Nostoc sp.]